MRGDVTNPADPTFFSRVGVEVSLYNVGVGPDDIVGVTGGGTDLTPFVTECTQTSVGATVVLSYQSEFDGASRPVFGQCVQIRQGSSVIFNGIVGSLSSVRENRGARRKELTLNVTTRDATPWWREARRATGVLTVGSDLSSLATGLAADLGVTNVSIPSTGVTLAHQNFQLCDMPAWDMMQTALEPGLMEPFVDARGVLKTLNRQLSGRTADISPTWAEVVETGAGVSRPPCTRFRVKYLAPEQARVNKATCRLASATLQLGFWKFEDSVDVWWSDDRRQRAEGLDFRVINSINTGNGLFSVAAAEDEIFEQLDEYHGRISVSMDVEGLLADLALGISVFAAGAVVGDWAPPFGGPTTSIGRVLENAAMIDIIQLMAKNGLGRYEIWGTPYDYVDAVNQVEAYDENAPEWATKVEELQNDLIPDDTVASGLAVNELLYRSRQNNRGEVSMADDLRLEPGDVVGLPDGRLLYCTDYWRDLSRGAEAVMRVEGFFI